MAVRSRVMNPKVWIFLISLSVPILAEFAEVLTPKMSLISPPPLIFRSGVTSQFFNKIFCWGIDLNFEAEVGCVSKFCVWIFFDVLLSTTAKFPTHSSWPPSCFLHHRKLPNEMKSLKIKYQQSNLTDIGQAVLFYYYSAKFWIHCARLKICWKEQTKFSQYNIP